MDKPIKTRSITIKNLLNTEVGYPYVTLDY